MADQLLGGVPPLGECTVDGYWSATLKLPGGQQSYYSLGGSLYTILTQAPQRKLTVLSTREGLSEYLFPRLQQGFNI